VSGSVVLLFMNDPTRLATKDAAKVLGVTVRTLMRWIHTDKIEYLKLGGRYYIKQATIDNLLETS
jgi:excisionase family DNA binding protein